MARALKWVAPASPESWLTEILPSGMAGLVFPILVAVPCPALYRDSPRAAVRAAESGGAQLIFNAHLLLFECDPEFPVQKAASTGSGPQGY